MDSINIPEVGHEKSGPEPETLVVWVGAEEAEVEVVRITRMGRLEAAEHLLEELGALAHHLLQRVSETLFVGFAQFRASWGYPD